MYLVCQKVEWVRTIFHDSIYLSYLLPLHFFIFTDITRENSEQRRLLLSPHPYSSIANPGTSGAPGDSVIVVDVPVRLDQPPAYHSSFQRSFGERLTDERRHHSHMKPLVGKELKIEDKL